MLSQNFMFMLTLLVLLVLLASYSRNAKAEMFKRGNCCLPCVYVSTIIYLCQIFTLISITIICTHKSHTKIFWLLNLAWWHKTGKFMHCGLWLAWMTFNTLNIQFRQNAECTQKLRWRRIWIMFYDSCSFEKFCLEDNWKFSGLWFLRSFR